MSYGYTGGCARPRPRAHICRHACVHVCICTPTHTRTRACANHNNQMRVHGSLWVCALAAQAQHKRGMATLATLNAKYRNSDSTLQRMTLCLARVRGACAWCVSGRTRARVVQAGSGQVGGSAREAAPGSSSRSGGGRKHGGRCSPSRRSCQEVLSPPPKLDRAPPTPDVRGAYTGCMSQCGQEKGCSRGQGHYGQAAGRQPQSRAGSARCARQSLRSPPAPAAKCNALGC